MPRILEGSYPGRPSPAHTERAPGHGSRCVLVVDGEPLIRWSLAAALEDRGYHVVGATDTDAALRVLADEAIDAVLLDCPLADSELERLRVIRLAAPQAAVVAMTAFPNRELDGKARELGVLQILEKPFDMLDVTAAIRRANLSC